MIEILKKTKKNFVFYIGRKKVTHTHTPTILIFEMMVMMMNMIRMCQESRIIHRFILSLDHFHFFVIVIAIGRLIWFSYSIFIHWLGNIMKNRKSIWLKTKTKKNNANKFDVYQFSIITIIIDDFRKSSSSLFG